MMQRKAHLLILAYWTSCRYLAELDDRSMIHLAMALSSRPMTSWHTICHCWHSRIQSSLSLWTVLLTTWMPRFAWFSLHLDTGWIYKKITWRCRNLYSSYCFENNTDFKVHSWWNYCTFIHIQSMLFCWKHSWCWWKMYVVHNEITVHISRH